MELRGRNAELLLKRCGKMTEVFESHLHIDIIGFRTFFHQTPCFLEPSSGEPSLWGKMKDAVEVVFEACQRAAREMGELLHSEVTAEILLHEVVKINLVRRGKIKENGSEAGTELKKYKDSFLQLAGHQIL